MSHTTKIDGVSINNPAIIRKAVENLQKRGVNVRLKQNQQPRMYYAHQAAEVGPCDYLLELPGSRYDVGLKKAQDGSYDVLFDEWGNDVSRQIGAQCPMPGTEKERSLWAVGQFMQEYAKEAAINTAQNQGYMVDDVTMDADGNVNLVLNVT
jgi:hypothetical protein